MDRRALRPLGVLTLLISLPIIEAAGMAAVAFIEEGEPVRATIGSVGVASGILLLTAGALLCARFQFGRVLAFWGSVGSIAAHILGALIGLVGGHGVLYGAAFPLAILLLIRATPLDGHPRRSEGSDTSTTSSARHQDRQLRAALATRPTATT